MSNKSMIKGLEVAEKELNPYSATSQVEADINKRMSELAGLSDDHKISILQTLGSSLNKHVYTPMETAKQWLNVVRSDLKDAEENG
jgi:hypothetical protein